MLGLLVGLGIASGLVPRDELGAAVDGTLVSGSPPATAPRPALATDPPAERPEREEAVAANLDAHADPRLRPDASPSPARADTAASPSLRRQPPPEANPAWSRIVLEPVAVAPSAVTAGIAGYDTGAPRELDLWRIRAGRAVRLGRAESDADARIHGPQLPLPAEGIVLVATPRGVAPGEPGASEPLRLARQPGSGSLAPAREGEPKPGLPRWRHSSATPTLTQASPEEEIR